MYKTQHTVLKCMTDMTVHIKQILVTDRIVYTTEDYRYDSVQNNVLVQTIQTLVEKLPSSAIKLVSPFRKPIYWHFW